MSGGSGDGWQPDDPAGGRGRRDPGGRGGDYRAARIGAASALTGVVVLLLVLDALLPQYDLDPVQLVSILGTIAALLGIEAVDVIRGRR
jgi:hypothetical protein